MNKIFLDDIERIANTSIEWSRMKHRNILVTGSTGLIGYNLVRYLYQLSRIKNLDIGIYAHVRNLDKAISLFDDISSSIHFVVGDITDRIKIDEPIHLIVHAASQTSSKAFVNKPVETINTSIQGTINIFDFARKNPVESVVYLSTMEVYGTPTTDEKITEYHHSNLNTMVARSCYPESKRMCENISASYYSEYGVPIKVIRLTQTIGPGVTYNDPRVFAEFARCAIERRDIVLHTKGNTKRSYLYSGDAVSAILSVLVSDRNGEVFNAANEETYCSILEMANTVANDCCGGAISVRIDEQDNKSFGYAPELHMNLDSSKLRALGWQPTRNLKDMYDILIEDMKNLK